MLDRITLLNETLKNREDVRVEYDHYRTKLNKMEKNGEATSQDIEHMERFSRNQMKFDEAKHKFDQLSKDANEILTKVEQKVDRVIVDLTLKFSKEVQMNLYKDMNQAFHKLGNIEGQMIEIAHVEQMK